MCVCLWCCCHSFQEAGSHFLEICGQADKRTQTINFEQLSTRQSISVVTKVSLSFVFCSILQRQGPKRSLQSLEDCLQHNNNFACKKLNTHTPGKHKHWEQLNLAVKYIIEQLYYNVNILLTCFSWPVTFLIPCSNINPVKHCPASYSSTRLSMLSRCCHSSRQSHLCQHDSPTQPRSLTTHTHMVSANMSMRHMLKLLHMQTHTLVYTQTQISTGQLQSNGLRH